MFGILRWSVYHLLNSLSGGLEYGCCLHASVESVSILGFDGIFISIFSPLVDAASIRITVPIEGRRDRGESLRTGFCMNLFLRSLNSRLHRNVLGEVIKKGPFPAFPWTLSRDPGRFAVPPFFRRGQADGVLSFGGAWIAAAPAPSR